jgi:hypothetical protein
MVFLMLVFPFYPFTKKICFNCFTVVILSVVGLNVNFLPSSLFQKRINLRTLWISKQMVKLNQSKKSPQNFSQGDQTFEKDFRMLHLLPQWHLYWRLSKTCAILLWWRYELQSLKGVFSKPSGKDIVAHFKCMKTYATPCKLVIS